MKKISIIIIVIFLSGIFFLFFNQNNNYSKEFSEKDVIKNLEKFNDNSFSEQQYSKFCRNVLENIKVYNNKRGVIKAMALIYQYKYFNDFEAYKLYEKIYKEYEIVESYYSPIKLEIYNDKAILVNIDFIYYSDIDSSYNFAILELDTEKKFKNLMNFVNKYGEIDGSDFYVDLALNNLIGLGLLEKKQFEYQKEYNEQNIKKDIIESLNKNDLCLLYKYINSDIVVGEESDYRYSKEFVLSSFILRAGSAYRKFYFFIDNKGVEEITIYKMNENVANYIIKAKDNKIYNLEFLNEDDYWSLSAIYNKHYIGGNL